MKEGGDKHEAQILRVENSTSSGDEVTVRIITPEVSNSLRMIWTMEIGS